MKKNEIKWLAEHNLTEPPTCPVCGGEVKFRGPKYGYSMFCSIQCLNKSDYRKQKTRETCQQKYGVSNPSQSNTIKQKKKDTTMKNYGVSNPMHSKKIKEKHAQGYLGKHGVSNPFANPEIIKKIKETQTRLYGGMGNGSDRTRKRILDTIQSREMTSRPYLVGYTEDGDWICKCDSSSNSEKCKNCDGTYITNHEIQRSRMKMNVITCTKIKPIGQLTSGMEIELGEYISSLGLSWNKDRDILDGKELDIYIPEKKVAIEMNGIYWHSNKPAKYHFNKWKKCFDQGIQLITIWEDQWIHKKDICKQIIASKLGIYEHRVFARQCELVSVDSKETGEFLTKYHIQGKSQGKIRYGLKYNGELVSVMTFGLKRKSMMGSKEAGDNEYELVRFCNKAGWQIVGGASRLFNHFLKDHNPTTVKSYSSNDISVGNLYKQLGFEMTHIGAVGYWYIHYGDMVRYHRYNFRKSALKKMGINIEGRTEREIMETLPYFKIHDSGTLTWEYKKRKVD